LRELKEAVIAVFSFGSYTTKFPKVPCEVPESLRGKPQFDDESCIGCGACANICPTNALIMEDYPDEEIPVRRITQRTDACIFCANCSDGCTTTDGINMSQEWDLATLDRESLKEVREYELQICESCGAVIGTKKHLVWLYDQLGALAYTNPALLLAKSGELTTSPPESPKPEEEEGSQTPDFMRIICPKCKSKLNLRL
jgi:formate hydrogenlyase subunit 6/NADH:ubiquinone oxidoreductase subunit I